MWKVSTEPGQLQPMFVTHKVSIAVNRAKCRRVHALFYDFGRGCFPSGKLSDPTRPHWLVDNIQRPVPVDAVAIRATKIG